MAGYQPWAVYLLSQLLVATAFWVVWRLARSIVSPLGALVSVLLLEGALFFNFTTPNLFPDLVELPCWALATRSFYRALRFRRLRDWVFLGLWLAVAASGLVFRPHWGYAMWSLIGLFSAMFLVPTVDEAGVRRFIYAWLGTFLFVALLYSSANLLAPYTQVHFGWRLFDRYAREAAFPSRQLAEEITRRWHDRVGEPLAFVIGSKWIAGHVSFFSEDHPLALRDGSVAQCPWIDIDEVRRRGAVVVWEPSRDFKTTISGTGLYPGWLASAGPQQRFPTMESQPPIVLPWRTGAALPPLQIMWGILYPEDRLRHLSEPDAEDKNGS